MSTLSYSEDVSDVFIVVSKAVVVVVIDILLFGIGVGIGIGIGCFSTYGRG